MAQTMRQKGKRAEGTHYAERVRRQRKCRKPQYPQRYGLGRTAIRRDGLEMLVSSNRKGSIGTNDIWVSTRTTTSGAWSTPVNLGPPINSGFSEGGSALSCDGTTMYFYSTRPGGFGGQDLYVSTRTQLCNDEDDSENNVKHHACKKPDD